MALQQRLQACNEAMRPRCRHNPIQFGLGTQEQHQWRQQRAAGVRCRAQQQSDDEGLQSCKEQQALEPDEVLTPQQADTQEPALPAAQSMPGDAVRWQLASRAVGGPAGHVTPLLGLGGIAVLGAMGESHPPFAALSSPTPSWVCAMVAPGLTARGGVRDRAHSLHLPEAAAVSLPTVWDVHQLHLSCMHTLPLLGQTCNCTVCADLCCSVPPAGSGLDISGPASTVGALSVLAAIVAIHECGHFVAAGLQNIHVTKFSIGFGPALLKWQASWQDWLQMALASKLPSLDGGQTHSVQHTV